ncbi:MAG: hypothetical protein L6Q78_09535 [Bacteroidia bacterium]|nr:hypothetical protein [Bacteroidia bacterium]
MSIKQVKESMETNKEIEADKFLRSLDTQGGFEVPVDYFEANTKRLSAFLRKEGPELPESIGGFQVPENYFENLRPTIPVKKGRIVRFRPLFNVAASFLLIGFTGFLLIRSNQTGSSKQSELSSLSQEEIINHLETQEFSADLLCEAGWCNEFQLLENEDKELNPLLDGVSEEDLTELING